MRFVRPAIAADPRHFGRGLRRVLSTGTPANRLSDDFKLFATTFVTGFLFVSILLA
jgi:hypothetical protein